jgi:hypothetical protein
MPDRQANEAYRRACHARTPEERALVDRLTDLHSRLTGLDSFFLPPADYAKLNKQWAAALEKLVKLREKRNGDDKMHSR